jgi:hypothetical protein
VGERRDLGVRIDFQRSGGFAGVVLRCSIDTARMTPEEAREIEELVSAVDPAALAAASPRPGRGADRFQYDLTIDREDQRHHLSFGEGELTPELRPLVTRLLEIARRR